jgi:hypothetical protein
MSWHEHHRESEQFASNAEVLQRQGEVEAARQNYAIAAAAEVKALAFIESHETRTFGITAVSAVALLFKAKDFLQAKQIAYQCLSQPTLPNFAIVQLEEILKEILVLEASAVAV